MRFSTCLALLALIGFTGCSTVESRIKKQPEVFNKLPENQKTLVRHREVTEGMGPEAVYLAWGRPDVVSNGSDHGHRIIEWVYETTTSDFISDYSPAPIFYGRHGRFYGGWDYSFSPVIISQTYPYKSIRFEDGKAVAWRKTPPGNESRVTVF